MMITNILAVLTALEFVYIFYLETIKTDSEKTAKTFGMAQEALRQQNLNVSMKNQGIYNLGIAILIVVCLATLPSSKLFLGLLMGYIVFVAAYGSITVDKLIILKQGGLAILTLISMVIVR